MKIYGNRGQNMANIVKLTIRNDTPMQVKPFKEVTYMTIL